MLTKPKKKEGKKMKKMMMIFVLAAFATMAFATTIYDIQYTEEAGPDGTYPSPMVDQEVTVTGIVTGANFNSDGKFFMSDPEGGAWSSIYVYDWEVAPALGDEVEVTGTVVEYYGYTELSFVTITILSSGNEVPAPMAVSTLDLAVPALAEQYESCLVELTDLEVTEAQNDYGEWYVTDGSGACQIDDGYFYLDEVTPPIEITAGMTWAKIIGNVDYSYDFYGVNPRTPADLIYELNADETALPLNVELGNNYPNPFNPTTTISYNLAEAAPVELSIYNTKGQLIDTLVNATVEAGTHSVVWDGTDSRNGDLSSGVFFYKIKSGRFTSTKKMILLK